MQRMQVSVQTMYADLVDRAWSGSFQELIQAAGSPYKRAIGGKDFWYLKSPQINGRRRPDLYLGPDSPVLQDRLSTLRDLREIASERIAITRALRAYNLPAPDALTGKIMSMLAEVGAFRLRAVVVGTAAFQTYSPMLGVKFPNAYGMTMDWDIAQFYPISVAVQDEIQPSMLEELQAVDPRFEAVSSPFDGRKTLKYAVKTGTQESFVVDILCPRQGADRSGITRLDALNTDAQALNYLDFLLYGEVNAVALYGIGIPINVPAPERFAIHKLIVSRLRAQLADSQAKACKDLAQAVSLIDVLLEVRPYELAAAWAEANARGPKWRENLEIALQRLPEEMRTAIGALPR